MAAATYPLNTYPRPPALYDDDQMNFLLRARAHASTIPRLLIFARMLPDSNSPPPTLWPADRVALNNILRGFQWDDIMGVAGDLTEPSAELAPAHKLNHARTLAVALNRCTTSAAMLYYNAGTDPLRSVMPEWVVYTNAIVSWTGIAYICDNLMSIPLPPAELDSE